MSTHVIVVKGSSRSYAVALFSLQTPRQIFLSFKLELLPKHKSYHNIWTNLICLFVLTILCIIDCCLFFFKNFYLHAGALYLSSLIQNNCFSRTKTDATFWKITCNGKVLYAAKNCFFMFSLYGKFILFCFTLSA